MIGAAFIGVQVYQFLRKSKEGHVPGSGDYFEPQQDGYLRVWPEDGGKAEIVELPDGVTPHDVKAVKLSPKSKAIVEVKHGVKNRREW